MKKVLIVTFSMSIGGLENILMSYFRNIDKDLFQIDFVINKAPSESSYIDEIKSSGGKIYYIDIPGQLGPVKYVKQLKAIIMNNGPYSTVHSNTEYHGGLVCLAAKKAGVKNRICHSHTTSVNKKRNLKLMPLYKLSIKLFSTLNLACSEKAGDFMFFRNYQILPNAIDVEKYQTVNEHKIEEIKRNFRLKSSDIVIGHIGRFSEEKNQKFIIDIMAEILKHSTNIYAIFVGDGEMRNEIEQYAKEKNVYTHVKFAGFQNHVNNYLHLFDYLLLPSFYEGLPVTIIEGQACGVISLVSDSVTKEVDLGMDLVRFLNIDNVNDWVKEVIKGKQSFVDKEVIRGIFSEKSYDIKTAANKLAYFYDSSSVI